MWSSTQKILASAAAGSLGLAWYMGSFSPVKMDDSKISSQLFVYKDQIGDYKNKASNLLQVKKDLSDISGKNYTITSVFYDNPLYVKDKSKERSVIGAMIDPAERLRVEQFLSKHPDYHVVETSDINTVSTKFPYRNNLSFSFMGWKGLYNRLCRYSTENKNVKSEERFVVERYPYLSGGEKVVEVMVPYGNNARQLNLSALPTPPKKDKLRHAYFTP